MKKILCFISCLVALTSCDYFTREKEQLTAQNDSLTLALKEKQVVLEQAMSAIADIQEGFRAINEAEGRIALQATGEGLTDAQRLKEDLQFIQQEMDDNRKQIEQLQKKLKASGAEVTSLRKVLANLQQELVDKTASLAVLHSELAQKNIRIAELDSAIVVLTADVNSLQAINESQHEVIKQQVSQLHVAWYVYGTAKELKEQNILKDGKVMSSTDFNKNYFTEIDTRDDTVFPLYSKHAKLLTTHPVDSYEFTKDASKQLTLSVIDAEAFWSVSRYMIIQVR